VCNADSCGAGGGGTVGAPATCLDAGLRTFGGYPRKFARRAPAPLRARTRAHTLRIATELGARHGPCSFPFPAVSARANGSSSHGVSRQQPAE